jgi:nitroreductase
MELIEAIHQRRAVRDYTRARVANSTLTELLDAAIQAPSAMNQQPWAFAVFQGQNRLLDYSVRAKAHFLATVLAPFGFHERGDTLTDPAYNIFYNAGTLLVICARHHGLNPAEDCCLAAQNFMLAAHAAGLGTCPIGLARPWLNLPEVKMELGLPPDVAAVFPMTVGYPAALPAATPRQAPDILCWKDADVTPAGS